MLNWHHLWTFLWLRHRLVVNRSKKSGLINRVIDWLVKIIIIVTTVAALVLGFIAGQTIMSDALPFSVMLFFDGLVVGYLMFLVVNVTSELHGGDILSLDRFMHLPVSLNGAFIINYLGSSINLTMLACLSLLTGLSAGMVISIGPVMLLGFLASLAFMFMMTALVFQFRRWLASMVTTPKRRQSILVTITVVFIMLMMLPSVFSAYYGSRESREEAAAATTAVGTGAPGGEPAPATRGPGGPFQAMSPADREKIRSAVVVANAVLPPGWLPYGVSRLRDDRPVPIILCLTGMILIGVLSLIRTYRTTVRMYLGNYTARRIGSSPGGMLIGTESSAARHANALGPAWLKLKIPGLPDQAAVIAAASCLNMFRDPMIKLTLMSPVLMWLMFSGMLAWKEGGDSAYRPVLAASALTVMIYFISFISAFGNMFAFDRNGYRMLVLSPVSRRDILLGKNLSFMPLSAVYTLVSLILCRWLLQVRLDHLAAIMVHTVPVYFLMCILGNYMSIKLPLVLKKGTGMPAGGQGLKTLLHMVLTIVLLVPVSLTFIPLGIDILVSMAGKQPAVSAYLVCELLLSAVVIGIYMVVINNQGELLQRHEHRILQVVTRKDD